MTRAASPSSSSGGSPGKAGSRRSSHLALSRGALDHLRRRLQRLVRPGVVVLRFRERLPGSDV